MRRISTRLLILMLAIFYATPCMAEETVKFGRFGTVTLYHQSERPSHVVLFVSGDGGWNLGVVDMARELASLDALVAGVDITHYLKSLESSGDKCSYPAADFEALSKFLQKKLGYEKYTPPVLVGYSSGATLVYAVIVQAPPGTFAGAISMGFCPDLPLTKTLCKGNGIEWTAGPKGKGFSFLPAPGLKTPWVAFQGDIDQVCDPPSVKEYVSKTGSAKVVSLPKVGHGFSVPRNWMPQFRESFKGLVSKHDAATPARPDTIKDLPLAELRPQAEPKGVLAVIISGDGGWAGIDREIGERLAGRGVAVVGLDSLQYFWNRRTPESSSADLDRIISHYTSAWGAKQVVLVGYSLGADVLPFMADRLPAGTLEKVTLLALLGPSRSAEFEFHLTDWVGGGSGPGALPTLPELTKLKGKRIICFCGSEEEDSLCNVLPPGLAEVVYIEGAHHFGGRYNLIADRIIDESLRQ